MKTAFFLFTTSFLASCSSTDDKKYRTDMDTLTAEKKTRLFKPSSYRKKMLNEAT